MSESSSKTTTDLETIRQWAEEREGKPSRVKSTADGEGGGVLRIDFPGYSGGDSLEEISWDDWYETFTDRNLAFLYQEETAGGKESRFFKLITDKESDHKDHKREEKKDQKDQKDKKDSKDKKPVKAKKEEKDKEEKKPSKAKEEKKKK